MNKVAMKQASAIIPILMSVGALAAVVIHIATSGIAPQPDEGTAAHLWQLLMLGQAPFIIYYSLKWLPLSPRTALSVLAAQIVAAIAAATPVFLLRW